MQKKILIVDDEPDILKVVTFRLKKMGHEVITATNGKEALDLIHREKLDLILLDLRMPLIDGYEVCRQIKIGDESRHIPIILLTVVDTNKIAEKMKEFKADDYIIKPFEPDELSNKINKFIN